MLSERSIIIINKFRPVGVVDHGSIPWVLAAVIALFLTLCRYVYIRLVLIIDLNLTKEAPMIETIKGCMRVLCSLIFKTVRSIGIGIIAGSHLLT